MIKLYVDLIHAGKMTLDQVPQRWRAAVAQALEE